jgi:hypothetical protein
MDGIKQLYKVEVNRFADGIEKQMKRYIMMQTIMRAEVYVELEKRGFKIDLLGGGAGKVMVVIYRK